MMFAADVLHRARSIFPVQPAAKQLPLWSGSISPSNTASPYYIQSRLSSSTASIPQLTHVDASGRPSMVNVSDKLPSKRTATATGVIYIPKIAYDLVLSSNSTASDDQSAPQLKEAMAKSRSKGDVLTVAHLAAVMGCKRTAELIPLCHPLPISHVAVKLETESYTKRNGTMSDETKYSIRCTASVSCEGKTGVEMETLTAVSVGLLTVWDMLKAVAGKEMTIGDILVTQKEGGKSGDFIRQYDSQDSVVG